LILSA
jgi:hypothetical protein